MVFEPVDRLEPGDLKKRLKKIHGGLTSKNQSYDVDREVYRRLYKHAKKIVSEGIEGKSSTNIDKRVRKDFAKGGIAGITKPQNAFDTLLNPLFRRKLLNLVRKPKREFADA